MQKTQAVSFNISSAMETWRKITAIAAHIVVSDVNRKLHYAKQKNETIIYEHRSI